MPSRRQSRWVFPTPAQPVKMHLIMLARMYPLRIAWSKYCLDSVEKQIPTVSIIMRHVLTVDREIYWVLFHHCCCLNCAEVSQIQSRLSCFSSNIVAVRVGISSRYTIVSHFCNYCCDISCHSIVQIDTRLSALFLFFIRTSKEPGSEARDQWFERERPPTSSAVIIRSLPLIF